MKHKIGTVLEQLPGGNKYRVIDLSPTPGSEFKGCYRLECIDFWCMEDLGDGIECWKLGEKHWVASFHADFMKVNTSSFYDE